MTSYRLGQKFSWYKTSERRELFFGEICQSVVMPVKKYGKGP